MADTTHRVLRLLGLLEARSTWSAEELAERLGVTERTVRRDVNRLRELGYPVCATRGLDGGYRLGAGRRLPPLLLEDDEAVALVACLRMAALAGADEAGEAALRALAKIDQLLPPRLHAIASALDTATRAIPRSRPAVELQVLQLLATAQRDAVLVRFEYVKPGGETSEREVEPARLMTQGEHWYLQAFDRGRDDWRVFRLDRMSEVRAATFRFSPRPAPSHDFQRSVAERYPCVVEVEMPIAVEAVARRIPAAHRDRLAAIDGGCRFRVGGPTWDDLAWHMLAVSRDLDCRFELGDQPAAPEFRAALQAIADQARTCC